jgi:hypothetical protein
VERPAMLVGSFEPAWFLWKMFHFRGDLDRFSCFLGLSQLPSFPSEMSSFGNCRVETFDVGMKDPRLVSWLVMDGEGG